MLTDYLPYPAPAKLNLFLHILGRRSDGYHLLQSVFQLIDWHDTVWLRPDKTGKIIRHNPLPDVPIESDLTWRAAKLLQDYTHCQQGVAIKLDKSLPIGGGVGGGSSDAATVMLALNQLWQLKLSQQELMSLGVKLGADIPFFLFGHNAFVEGIGEIMTPICTQEAWFVILHPPIKIPTSDIFQANDLVRNTPAITVEGIKKTIPHNDLEPVAFRKYPILVQYRDWLSQYAPAQMTGSGSCIFARFTSQAEANLVASRLPRTMRGCVARSLSQHPLHRSELNWGLH